VTVTHRNLLWAASYLAALGCGSEPSRDTHEVGAQDAAMSVDGGSGGATSDATTTDGSASDASGLDGAPFACSGAGARFVTGSPSHQFGDGQNVGQATFPAPILGPPRGEGACQGSLDVVSLGNGGSVVVEFAGNAIVDGPGADFIVFENAFGLSCNLSSPFVELATVSVSDDGATWVEFPCTAVAAPYGSCAGWNPVYANADTNTIDPLDPAVAGGDAFDLADVGVARARYVRIVDRVDITGTAGVFDLDAVSIVNAACP
jgi:hypothetical protein